MNCRELRIGNLIYEIDKFKGTDVVPVIGLVENDFNLLEHSGRIKPIPLTEEWLVKFGFVNKVDYEQQEHEWGILSKENTRRGVGVYNFTGDRYLDYWCVTFREDVGCGWCDLNEIEYVHQLQNIYFALTGEELTYA